MDCLKCLPFLAFIFCHITSANSAFTLIDMSYKLGPNLPKFASVCAFERYPIVVTSPIWYQFECLKMGTHYGTHIDAPAHFWKGGWTIDQIPMERLTMVKAVVVNIMDKVFKPNNGFVVSDYEITVADIQHWEKINGAIPPDSVVLFLTGWSQFWPKSVEYLGTFNISDEKSYHFPGLSCAAASYLVTRKIYGVGIDTLSMDRGVAYNKLDAHKILAGKNVWIAENLNSNLSKMPATGAWLFVGVPKLFGGSGMPASIVGMLGDVPDNAPPASGTYIGTIQCTTFSMGGSVSPMPPETPSAQPICKTN